MLRALDLGGGERSLERKPELRSPSTAPSLRDNSVERERSAERRDTGTSLVDQHLLDSVDIESRKCYSSLSLVDLQCSQS